MASSRFQQAQQAFRQQQASRTPVVTVIPAGQRAETRGGTTTFYSSSSGSPIQTQYYSSSGSLIKTVNYDASGTPSTVSQPIKLGGSAEAGRVLEVSKTPSQTPSGQSVNQTKTQAGFKETRIGYSASTSRGGATGFVEGKPFHLMTAKEQASYLQEKRFTPAPANFSSAYVVPDRGAGSTSFAVSFKTMGGSGFPSESERADVKRFTGLQGGFQAGVLSREEAGELGDLSGKLQPEKTTFVDVGSYNPAGVGGRVSQEYRQAFVFKSEETAEGLVVSSGFGEGVLVGERQFVTPGLGILPGKTVGRTPFETSTGLFNTREELESMTVEEKQAVREFGKDVQYFKERYPVETFLFGGRMDPQEEVGSTMRVAHGFYKDVFGGAESLGSGLAGGIVLPIFAKVRGDERAIAYYQDVYSKPLIEGLQFGIVVGGLIAVGAVLTPVYAGVKMGTPILQKLGGVPDLLKGGTVFTGFKTGVSVLTGQPITAEGTISGFLAGAVLASPLPKGVPSASSLVSKAFVRPSKVKLTLRAEETFGLEPVPKGGLPSMKGELPGTIYVGDKGFVSGGLGKGRVLGKGSGVLVKGRFDLTDVGGKPETGFDVQLRVEKPRLNPFRGREFEYFRLDLLPKQESSGLQGSLYRSYSPKNPLEFGLVKERFTIDLSFKDQPFTRSIEKTPFAGEFFKGRLPERLQQRVGLQFGGRRVTTGEAYRSFAKTGLTPVVESKSVNVFRTYKSVPERFVFRPEGVSKRFSRVSGGYTEVSGSLSSTRLAKTFKVESSVYTSEGARNVRFTIEDVSARSRALDERLLKNLGSGVKPPFSPREFKDGGKVTIVGGREKTPFDVGGGVKQVGLSKQDARLKQVSDQERLVKADAGVLAVQVEKSATLLRRGYVEASVSKTLGKVRLAPFAGSVGLKTTAGAVKTLTLPSTKLSVYPPQKITGFDFKPVSSKFEPLVRTVPSELPAFKFTTAEITPTPTPSKLTSGFPRVPPSPPGEFFQFTFKPPPVILFPGVGHSGMPFGSPLVGRATGGKRPLGYQADLASRVLGIRGKMPRPRKGLFTGLERRPLVNGVRKRRRKK